MKTFLVNEFGPDQGGRLFDLQQSKLREILESTKGNSDTQQTTLKKTILPRIALYKVLSEEFGDQKKAYAVVEKYMLTVVGPKLNKQYSSLEFLPGYFTVFRKIMAGTVKKSDNWVTKIVKNDGEAVEYNITKCLWHDACTENGCPELCKVFCDVDHVIYAGMKKVRFVRTETLGTGGSRCDFRFLNKGRQKHEP